MEQVNKELEETLLGYLGDWQEALTDRPHRTDDVSLFCLYPKVLSYLAWTWGTLSQAERTAATLKQRLDHGAALRASAGPAPGARGGPRDSGRGAGMAELSAPPPMPPASSPCGCGGGFHGFGHCCPCCGGSHGGGSHGGGSQMPGVGIPWPPAAGPGMAPPPMTPPPVAPAPMSSPEAPRWTAAPAAPEAPSPRSSRSDPREQAPVRPAYQAPIPERRDPGDRKGGPEVFVEAINVEIREMSDDVGCENGREAGDSGRGERGGGERGGGRGERCTCRSGRCGCREVRGER